MDAWHRGTTSSDCIVAPRQTTKRQDFVSLLIAMGLVGTIAVKNNSISIGASMVWVCANFRVCVLRL